MHDESKRKIICYNIFGGNMAKGINKQLDNKQIIYLDIIKIFACFMVIINHTNGLILESKSFENITFYCIMFPLCKVAVGLFLMITGVLVLNKNYNYKKIFKCIFRVFVPVFFLSLVFYIKDTGIHNINIILFLKSILISPYVLHYWYIYALISIYLVLPFIQKMVKKFTNKDYIIFTLIFLLFPTFINFLNIYLNLKINYNLQLAFFPVIVAIMICGNFLAKIKISKKYFIIALSIFIFSYIGMLLSMYLPYLNIGEISYKLDSWNSFPVVLMAITLFYIVRCLFENNNYSDKKNSLISTIASTTFGIYLIHTVFNYKLYKLSIMQSIFEFNSIIAIIVLDLIVFIVCMIIIYVLRKIPFIKRFL